MSTYGYDDGFNKVEVPTSVSFTELVATVAAKQAKLNATQGTAQTDCNDLTSTGVYYVPSTATNVPSSADYIVLVFPLDDEGTIITQIAISTGSTLFYVRTYASASWTAWNSVASSTQGLVTETFISSSLPVSSTGKNGDAYYYIQNNLLTKMYVKVNGSWQENTGSVSSMSIGTVTTGSVGSQAAVTITGTPVDPILNFTIPGTGKIYTGTLTAGETTLIIEGDTITRDSLIDIYVDIYGVEPTAASVTDGAITLTFAAQSYDVGVKVVVG